MYLTSFIHRKELLDIAERWFWGKPDAADALKLTQIFISDGYVIGETLDSVIDRYLGIIYPHSFRKARIRTKGELRDVICGSSHGYTPRVEFLCSNYRKNPEYYYQQAPINGVLCIDDFGRLLGSYRIKRPRRIAEKANRRIAQWIFGTVQEEARMMAQIRAMISGVPLEGLLTSEAEMVREFVEAEEIIAGSFRAGAILFDREAITINDVGGIKILGEEDDLRRVEETLRADPSIKVLDREDYRGDYEATSLVLEIPWDPGAICRKYRESRHWEKYFNRGIPESELIKGLEPLLEGAEPRINIELILSTYGAMVESELGNSIHEERIIAQRDSRVYKGYIPMNVEFLLEYLFAVGFSPGMNIEPLPIKLWGRYLPDTLVMYIRRLYRLPEFDLFY
ncbi:MAG: hypothetical protein WAW37_08165 [Syntrophobacteraceae bacterium]